MSELIVQGKRYPCRGILFDKDGTLLDFIQLWKFWARSILDMMEQHLAVAGAGFTVEKGTVLGTVHDQEGRVIGYDPSLAYHGDGGRKYRGTGLAALYCWCTVE